MWFLSTSQIFAVQCGESELDVTTEVILTDSDRSATVRTVLLVLLPVSSLASVVRRQPGDKVASMVRSLLLFSISRFQTKQYRSEMSPNYSLSFSFPRSVTMDSGNHFQCEWDSSPGFRSSHPLLLPVSGRRTSNGTKRLHPFSGEGIIRHRQWPFGWSEAEKKRRENCTAMYCSGVAA